MLISGIIIIQTIETHVFIISDINFVHKSQRQRTMVETILTIIAFLLLAFLVFVVSFFVLQEAPTVDDVVKRVDVKKILSSSVAPWSERLRGIEQTRYEGMPPCFEHNPSVRDIYSVLAARDKIVHHRMLLDVLSIMLCQSADTCAGDQSKFKERLIQMLGSGANPQDKAAQDTVKAYIREIDTNKSIAQFLFACVHMLDRHVRALSDDGDVPTKEKELIQGHVRTFLATVLEDIYRKCV